LSVLGGSLSIVLADIPAELRGLCEEQGGVISRSQILDAGLAKDVIYSRIKSGRWQRIYAGVYAVFSGEVPRETALWAAVLCAGPGAMLSHRTAAELWKLADEPSSLVHIVVPAARRVTRRPGITIHLSARAGAALHPARNPPRTRVEETVLDLWETARTLDDAVGWVTRALGRRLTTQAKLRDAMDARQRVRWRVLLAELLSPDAAGIHSVLEYRYVRHVERPHGLSGAKRQARVRRDGRSEYRDQLYGDYGTAIELDGRAAHPGDTRWNDIRRDNAAAALGITTLRYGWLEVTTNPCAVAAEIALVLTSKGYLGARPCCATCPVGRPPARDHARSPRRNSDAAAGMCRVPARSGIRSRATGAKAAAQRP
jgi:hypothetical protein